MNDTNDALDRAFAPFRKKMEADGAGELIINAFHRSFSLLHSGSTGKVSRNDIDPVEAVPALDELEHDAADDSLLGKVAIIKLNGGLGTSMGLDRAKSIIPVKDGLHFIDIIARQVERTNKRYDVHIPVMFMNSFNTHDDTIEALKPYAGLRSDIPFDFLQHKVPKVLADTLSPAEAPSNPGLEWCPPGHGDIYIAMLASGVLDALLEHGYEYVFVSNADNLGAVLDGRIPRFMHDNTSPFLMEVAQRTPADRKGGHLAQLKSGRLTLREIAQCPDEEKDEFQNIDLYRFFNTNSIWIHLPALKQLLDEHAGVPPLPLIRNEKPLNPRDPASPKVYQLESAMGAAISLFENSAALLVPRTRFAPVKTTDDLLAVRSDAYILTDDFQIIPSPHRSGAVPTVQLDKSHYKHLDQLESAFPYGPPSLKECSLFLVEGPYVFGKNVQISGNIELRNPSAEQKHIEDNAILISV